MADFEALRITDFDHLEFAVADLDKSSDIFLRLGFEKAGSREILERKLRSYLLIQNNVTVLLSQSSLASDPVASYVSTHGDGVINIAFRCEDAVSALEVAVNRGAEVADSPKAYKKDFGAVQQASIKALGDVRHTFITRQGNLFAEGFDQPFKPHTKGFGLDRIDHVASNVELGQLAHWTEFYQRVFGLNCVLSFNAPAPIGVASRALQSPNGIIKMPLNEPGGEKSRIQEYIDVHHGAGVQHVAFGTSQITQTIRGIRQEGVRFLDVPATYYEILKERIPSGEGNLSELEQLGILMDIDEHGRLMQAYTDRVVGPFFFEIIQRTGSTGFGYGNLTTLLDATEREQVRRGVLKST